MTTETHYQTIIQSSIFRIDGPEIDLADAIIALANAVADDDREGYEIDAIGEYDECGGVYSMLIGAYWTMTDWYGGMHSPEYAALCAIGRVFDPGMTSGPEPESGEQIAYDMLSEYMAGR